MKSDRNDRASVALVELRKAMKMTQQEFAVQVLQSAITTVSRYESGNPPPRGDVLLRLRDIAREQGLGGLADNFQSVWLEEIHKALGHARTILIAEDGTGLLVASLEGGAEAFAGAETFLAILQQLDSADPKFRQNAISALSAQRVAARRFDPPGHHDIKDAFMAAVAGPPVKVEKKKSDPKDRRKEKSR